jgi:hypothetical protein
MKRTEKGKAVNRSDLKSVALPPMFIVGNSSETAITQKPKIRDYSFNFSMRASVIRLRVVACTVKVSPLYATL